MAARLIERRALLARIERSLKSVPVTALLGPRQCGKTTIARIVAARIVALERRRASYFDLENPADIARLDAPMSVLEDLRGLVVIDEVQRLPGLFPLLRVLADKGTRGRRFLILGSASPRIVRGITESLAGRIRQIDMTGFRLEEIGRKNLDRLWLRGGLPRPYLARSSSESMDWRDQFIRVVLERDIPQLGYSIPAMTLRRFWTMAAHYHGQVWNAAVFARSLGSSEPTARRYLDLLTSAYLLRQLPPWHENLKKRQVKAPKIYVRDSGLLHSLLSVSDKRELMSHPKLGASWEGFAIEQVLSDDRIDDAFFWATHSGAELDLLVFRKGKRIGYEFKREDAPRMTRSLGTAIKDLALHRAFIVYLGTERYRIDRKVEAVPAADLEKVP